MVEQIIRCIIPDKREILSALSADRQATGREFRYYKILTFNASTLLSINPEFVERINFYMTLPCPNKKIPNLPVQGWSALGRKFQIPNKFQNSNNQNSKKFGNWKPARPAGGLEIGNYRLWRAGFTFIELLVSVGILGIISTIGVASYNNFNDQRVVEKAAEELKTNLRLVQSKAMNNEKDTTICSASSLLGWYANLANQTYYGQCDTNSFGTNTLVDLDLNDDGNNELKLSSNTLIFFRALGGTELSNDLTIVVSYLDDSHPLSVTITKSGDIK